VRVFVPERWLENTMKNEDKICLLSRERMKQISGSSGFQTALATAALLIMGNLNALVDYFLHPDIPYFDQGHLIVGAATSFVSALLFGVVLIHARYLSRALSTIRTMEKLLPICCNCKSVRRADADPAERESWQPIEAYITETTASRISHGICPECVKKLYPELALKL